MTARNNVFLLFLSGALTIHAQNVDLAQAALEDSCLPIRPGGVAEQPFWNGKARAFMYAPSFNFAPVADAVNYRFTVTDAKGREHRFLADTPQAPLSPVWKDVVPGRTVVTVVALDKDSQPLALAGDRTFARTATFTGHYPPKARSYRESARLALSYLFHSPYVQHWLKDGQPAPDYRLYCYPAKLMSAVVQGMCTYSELEPEDRENALKIACAAADFLISISDPAGAPLEFMPPTYRGNQLTAKQYQGQNMMIYPYVAGLAYLRLAEFVKDDRYVQAAIRIGETYLKLQLPNGSWYLKIDQKTGKKVGDNFCAEPNMLRFFWQLAQITHDARFNKMADHLHDYLMKNLVKNFNWEGQFEDVRPCAPYENLTKHEAGNLLIMELQKHPDDQQVRATARELLRFCEDQFVVWEKPVFGNAQWHYPSALEQYSYYVPIDASIAKMICIYLAMYESDPENNQLDLAKALAMADSLTRTQFADSGRIPTHLYAKMPAGNDWLNCMVASANALFLAAKYEK